jgi:hypothetical protein
MLINILQCFVPRISFPLTTDGSRRILIVLLHILDSLHSCLFQQAGPVEQVVVFLTPQIPFYEL